MLFFIPVMGFSLVVTQLSASLGFAIVGSGYFAIAAGQGQDRYGDAVTVALGIAVVFLLLSTALAVRLPRRHVEAATPTNTAV